MVVKRVFDVVFGTALATLATPLIVGLALACWIDLKAWPFFVQERIGLAGRPFRFVKLRTLPADTDRYADKYALSEVRVSRLGGALRRLHLDELPQLYLVPLGRLSLVGPRAEMAVLHDRMPAAFARARTSVRPGCTGLWQISSDAGRLILESPEHDLLYLQHANLRMDLWLLWRTARVMLGAGRAVDTTEDVPRWALRRWSGQESGGVDLASELT